MTYKDRLNMECSILETKVIKLTDMLKKYKNDCLDFVPTCSYELLYEQLIYMERYLSILKERLFIEKINL